MSETNRDYYDILGVPKDASAEDINKAFRKLARELHPDLNKAPDAEKRFKEVSEAYETLSDPGKRSRYDMVRSGGFSTQNPYARSTGAGGAGAGAGGAGGYQDPWSVFWGPFTDFAGYTGASGRKRPSTAPYTPERGASRHVALSLTADEARNGAERSVTYERFEPCSHCGGSGAADGDAVQVCPTCHGQRTVTMTFTTFAGEFEQTMTCHECNGSGRVITSTCPHCGGSGLNLSRATVKIKIPPGTHDGMVVRTKGAGDKGRNGGSRGDLLVDITVPSEHLNEQQKTVFLLLGMAVAIGICVFVPQVILRLMSLFALPIFFVLFTFPMYRRRQGGSFAARAAKRLGFGFLLGMILFGMFYPLVSCGRIF